METGMPKHNDDENLSQITREQFDAPKVRLEKKTVCAQCGASIGLSVSIGGAIEQEDRVFCSDVCLESYNG